MKDYETRLLTAYNRGDIKMGLLTARAKHGPRRDALARPSCCNEQITFRERVILSVLTGFLTNAEWELSRGLKKEILQECIEFADLLEEMSEPK